MQVQGLPVLGRVLKRVAEACFIMESGVFFVVRLGVYRQVILRHLGFLAGTAHAAQDGTIWQERSDHATIVIESILE